MSDHLGKAYPKVAQRLRKTAFALLPTPLSEHAIELPHRHGTVLVKQDNLTNPTYGGNKVRKLEYLLQRAKERGAKRVATFGTVGSNHALATAIHAREIGMDCTCFLAHQRRTLSIAGTLDKHLELGTELVRLGAGSDRLELFRRYLQNRKTWVIPLGGSSWLGAVGFVNAGLELADQLKSGNIKKPDRIYVANGTMGTVAGLAVGLALANLATAIHAVRVTDNRFTRREVLDRLIDKVVTLLNRFDPSIPADLATRCNIVWRDDFCAGGYAAVDTATANAIEFAREQTGVILEPTYTGKAMAALLHDLATHGTEDRALFWNTYSAAPRAAKPDAGLSRRNLPRQFLRYYE